MKSSLASAMNRFLYAPSDGYRLALLTWVEIPEFGYLGLFMPLSDLGFVRQTDSSVEQGGEKEKSLKPWQRASTELFALV